jgi:hypothetical protein
MFAAIAQKAVGISELGRHRRIQGQIACVFARDGASLAVSQVLAAKVHENGRLRRVDTLEKLKEEAPKATSRGNSQ